MGDRVRLLRRPCFSGDSVALDDGLVPGPLGDDGASEMSLRVAAVAGEITWRTAWGSVRRTSWPFRSRRARTTWGCISRPPLASAPNAASICIPVTDTSWPIEMVARDSPDHRSGGRSWPRLSPGRPTPVRFPKPNAVMWR